MGLTSGMKIRNLEFRIMDAKSPHFRAFGFSGFGKFGSGSGKPESARNSVGRATNLRLGILGQLGHSGARVSSGKSEPLGYLGQFRALGIPRITQPDKSPLHFRPIRSAIFACSFLLIVTLLLRSIHKMFEISKNSKKTIEKSLQLSRRSKISFFIN